MEGLETETLVMRGKRKKALFYKKNYKIRQSIAIDIVFKFLQIKLDWKVWIRDGVPQGQNARLETFSIEVRAISSWLNCNLMRS